MSEDKSQKTEKPTSRRLKKAKEQGQVAKSKDVTSLVAMFFIFAYLFIALPFIKTDIFEFTSLIFDAISGNQTTNNLENILGSIINIFLKAVIPLAFMSAAGAIIASIAQIGFIFSTKPISPDIKKINPVEGFKRIFSKKNIIEFLKNITKLIVIVLISSVLVATFISDILHAPYCGFDCANDLIIRIIQYFTLSIFSIFFIIAIFDWKISKAQFIEDQKMSKDDVKRERKDSQGNQEVKSKRLGIQIEDAANILKDKISRIKLLIYYGDKAVGLEIVPGGVPIIIAKIKGPRTQKLIHLAVNRDIPIADDVETLNALWKKSKENESIPKAAYPFVIKYMIKHQLM